MSKHDITITPEIRAILSASAFGTDLLTLPETMPREKYVAVNKVIEAAGGKWNRGAKGHVFPPEYLARFQRIIEGSDEKIIDLQAYQKKELNAFYTPPAIAAIAASYLGIGPDCTVLEPSAGRGALATAAYNIEADVTCVEIDKDACTDLRSLGFEVFNFDFLDLTPKALGELCDVPGGKFDAVLMNPPFSKGRDAAHVKHALNFDKRGGRIVAIIAKSFTFRDDRAYAEFRDIFAAHNGTIVRELPEGTFKDAGTNIATYLITLDK